jgi:MFS family permease
MSLVLLGLSLLWLPYVSGIGGLLGALAVLAIGSGLNRPPLFGMISKLTPEHEQGATLGVAQSSGSLARIVAPVFAASIYDVRADLPYIICALVSFFAAGLCWYMLVSRESAQELPAPGAA